MNARWRRLLGWCLVAIVLALCFAAYFRPGFMFDMATRVAMCF
ncbi:hypothetical protein [Pseudoduganella dura]|nr:hypothetical protein [Pseudoduganella dura]